MDFQNLFTAKKGQVERYGSGDLPTGGSGVNFGGHKERWVLAEPKKLWKERQKNSDAFRESLNNRACFSNLSYFHGTCNIFQPCSGCAGLPGHTLPSGLRRGNTVQKHNEPWWLYFKMSFIMECYQIFTIFRMRSLLCFLWICGLWCERHCGASEQPQGGPEGKKLSTSPVHPFQTLCLESGYLAVLIFHFFWGWASDFLTSLCF